MPVKSLTPIEKALVVLYEAAAKTPYHDRSDYEALDWLKDRFAPDLDIDT